MFEGLAELNQHMTQGQTSSISNWPMKPPAQGRLTTQYHYAL